MLLKSAIEKLKQAKNFARNPMTEIGAYPLVLITADGSALCHCCTRGNWQSICHETFQNTNCGFRVSGVSVNWENNDLYCDHCNASLLPAY